MLTGHYLHQYKNFEDDFLFWCKKFLSYKLGIFLAKNNIETSMMNQILKELDDTMSWEDLKRFTISIKSQAKSLWQLTNSLSKYHKFLSSLDIKDIAKIAENDLQNDFFTRWLSDIGNNTKIVIRSVLNQFFVYISKNHINIDGEIFTFQVIEQFSKSHEEVMQWLTQDELLLLNSYINSQANKTMDNLIVKVLMHSGITVSELCNIKLTDIAIIKNKYIVFNINSHSKSRTVTVLLKNISSGFLDFLVSRKELSEEYFFHSARDPHKQLGSQYVLDITKRMVLKSGVSKIKVTAEMLRSTHAIMLGNMGVPPISIKERLGHKSISTTMAILKNCNKKIEVYDDFMVADKTEDIYN